MISTNTPLAIKELDALKKSKDLHFNNFEEFEAWDKFFFTRLLQQESNQSHTTATSPYFTVGNVFAGLSDIFYSLYGVRLVIQDTIPGEIWHPDVRKLSVIHDTEGTIGTIYCDLFQREQESIRKYDNAAHFTVRCCRRIDDDEPDLMEKNWRMTNKKMEREVYINSKPKMYQMPIVVLVTSFNRPQNEIPGLLDLPDIETLFHEMGHAMHCN
jgi:mitochondrial intermediate peptidase